MDFVVRYAEQKCTEKERRRLKIVELNKENMKKIRWLIAFSVLLYLGALWTERNRNEHCVYLCEEHVLWSA